MQKAFDWVKANKKIIVAVSLVILLLIILYFINTGSRSQTAATYISTEDKSYTEQKLTRILAGMEGVGTTDVMINESDGEITGVIIVCGGAENIMTRNNILNAVSTALNIDKKIIAIYAMKN